VGATRSATDAAREQWLGEQQCTFQSFAAVAADAPTDAPPRDTQPTASITLEHTESHCFVHACLYSKLAASATLDSLLITRPADVLFFNVQHVGTSLPSFHIEPRLYLDAFCWEQRHGARIDGSEQARRLAEDDARLAALQGKRGSLHSPASQEGSALRRTASLNLASVRPAPVAAGVVAPAMATTAPGTPNLMASDNSFALASAAASTTSTNVTSQGTQPLSAPPDRRVVELSRRMHTVDRRPDDERGSVVRRMLGLMDATRDAQPPQPPLRR